MQYKFKLKSIIGMQSTVLGLILTLSAIYLAIKSFFIPAVFFALISIPFFLLKKYILFAPIEKFTLTYYNFLGIPLGFKKKYDEVKGIKITRVISTQRVNSRVNFADIKETGYAAFLFVDNSRIMLKFDQDKKNLAEEMESISKNHSIPLKIS
ncbi:hypothetical protein HZR84_07510 [Hyphobacterium sp. CCMP332]|nr:hypothetical protein HZR84_07510 [Hyphobacterium sp. CCMP332]